MLLQEVKLRCEDNQEIINWLDTVAKKELKKSIPPTQIELEHIIDYLLSSKAPKRLLKMSYEQAKKSTDKWDKSLQKKGAKIEEASTDLEVVKKFDDGFKWVKLVGTKAFEREGFLMRHCVSSYSKRKDITILSLRDRNNNPHCTVEVSGDNKQINQIKGKGNGPIHPKYINKVINLLQDYMKVRDSELENLGYFKLSKKLQKIVESKFDGAIFMAFNKKKYFYRYSSLIKKESNHVSRSN